MRSASRRSYLELAIVPSAVRIARHWAADQLAQARPRYSAELVDAAVLVVSELVTNAITAVAKAAAPRDLALSHGLLRQLPGKPVAGDFLSDTFLVGTVLPGTVLPGALLPGQGRVWMVITASPQLVRIAVHDSACAPLPQSCHRDDEAESGRGLSVVTALAAACGWQPDAHGKVVWCELAASGS
ncbi:MAG TPA: ATP-binding protein [Streptosporangiaceae bacterium]|nr:ATP-binding protein [Streptosporangiaceae bacterium]